jgi:uncharacterized membrane protein
MEILDNENKGSQGRSVNSVLTEGYEFRLGDYINTGFRLFGNDAGMYIGFLLLFFVISIVLGFIPFLGTIASLVVGAPLMAGFFHFAQRQHHGATRSFNNFFDGFKSPLWLNYVLSTLIIQVFTAIIVLVCALLIFSFVGWDELTSIVDLSKIDDPEEMSLAMMGMWNGGIALAVFLCIIIAIVITTLYVLTPMFIAFRQMTFWDAMEASRKVVSKAFPQFFVMLLILVVLMFLGAFMCFVGLLVMVPVYYLTLFAAFEDIMGSGEVDQQ